MADVVDQQTRSRMMAGIRGKNTKPELLLRRALHARGFRYRLHGRDVPGKPDLVLPKHQAVVFVHGCFWHHHQGCRFATTPSTRPDFWQAKFTANRSRDAKVASMLTRDGWRIATVWECALRKGALVTLTAVRLETWLDGNVAQLEIGELDLPEAAQ